MSKMQSLLFVSLAGAVLSQGPSFAQQATGDSKEVADLKKQVEALKRENAERDEKIDEFLLNIDALEAAKAKAEAERDELKKLLNKLMPNKAPAKKAPVQDRANRLPQWKKTEENLPSNPPIVRVVGSVARVDGKLLEIDVGSDHGLKKDHTLQVSRLTPNAEYLGVLRIVEVHGTRAVGEMQPLRGRIKAIKVGDTVSDTVQ